jgi:hypothetical protein
VVYWNLLLLVESKDPFFEPFATRLSGGASVVITNLLVPVDKRVEKIEPDNYSSKKKTKRFLQEKGHQ